MIPRYTRPEMGRIWSEENKYRQWLEVELAAAEALAETGELPREAAEALRRYARVDIKRLQEIKSAEHLRAFAEAQHVPVDAKLKRLDDIRKAIVTAAEQRLADRKAAAS